MKFTTDDKYSSVHEFWASSPKRNKFRGSWASAWCGQPKEVPCDRRRCKGDWAISKGLPTTLEENVAMLRLPQYLLLPRVHRLSGGILVHPWGSWRWNIFIRMIPLDEALRNVHHIQFSPPPLPSPSSASRRAVGNGYDCVMVNVGSVCDGSTTT